MIADADGETCGASGNTGSSSTIYETALLSVYVALGFFGSTACLSEAEADGYGGHIGAASRCVEAAHELAAAVAAIQSAWPDIDHPGVLAYEVAEGLGQRLRAGGQANDHRVETVEVLAAFFKPDARTNADVGIDALRGVASAALHTAG